MEIGTPPGVEWVLPLGLSWPPIAAFLEGAQPGSLAQGCPAPCGNGIGMDITTPGRERLLPAETSQEGGEDAAKAERSGQRGDLSLEPSLSAALQSRATQLLASSNLTWN